MARIELDLAHAYRANPQRDEDYALLPLKMTFDNGGAYALLGPSGCGKTTLLNIVSGLVKPSRGGLTFDGRDVTQQTPQQRNIAQVFQFPVIYDTMTVAQNLAFPLRNRGVASDKIAQRVGKGRALHFVDDALHARPALTGLVGEKSAAIVVRKVGGDGGARGFRQRSFHHGVRKGIGLNDGLGLFEDRRLQQRFGSNGRCNGCGSAHGVPSRSVAACLV